MLEIGPGPRRRASHAQALARGFDGVMDPAGKDRYSCTYFTAFQVHHEQAAKGRRQAPPVIMSDFIKDPVTVSEVFAVPPPSSPVKKSEVRSR